MSPPQQQGGAFLIHPGYYGHHMMAATHHPYHPAAAGQPYGVYCPPPPHAGGAGRGVRLRQAGRGVHACCQEGLGAAGAWIFVGWQAGRPALNARHPAWPPTRLLLLLLQA